MWPCCKDFVISGIPTLRSQHLSPSELVCAHLPVPVPCLSHLNPTQVNSWHLRELRELSCVQYMYGDVSLALNTVLILSMHGLVFFVPFSGQIPLVLFLRVIATVRCQDRKILCFIADIASIRH